MARRSLWPKGFTGRVVLVLVLAVLVQFIAGSLLIRAGEMHIRRQDQGKRIAEQLLIAERIIKTAEPQDRARLLENLSTIHTQLTLVTGQPRLAPGIDPQARLIADQMFAYEPALADHPIRLSQANGSFIGWDQNLTGAIEIEDGVWIRFESDEVMADWPVLLSTSIRIGLIALIILGSAAVLVRTLSAPLRRLSENSQMIGTSGRIDFDETAGPQELREVSRALNDMQERLEGVIEQRTLALLAVSHDLRTPLARLQLRMDGLVDPQDRRAARNDIDQMTRMLQELLEFFDTGDAMRAREATDPSSLCQTIGEAASDLGADVAFEGPDQLVIEGVHDHLARGIENLVDNAVKYAGSAMISLTELPGSEQITVTVDDRGPGIPPEQLDRVMRPFERLDRSRSDRHPGMGLGLSIAENVARAHGGTLRLGNRPGGGLRAELILPRKAPAETL